MSFSASPSSKGNEQREVSAVNDILQSGLQRLQKYPPPIFLEPTQRLPTTKQKYNDRQTNIGKLNGVKRKLTKLPSLVAEPSGESVDDEPDAQLFSDESHPRSLNNEPRPRRVTPPTPTASNITVFSRSPTPPQPESEAYDQPSPIPGLEDTETPQELDAELDPELRSLLQNGMPEEDIWPLIPRASDADVPETSSASAHVVAPITPASVKPQGSRKRSPSTAFADESDGDEFMPSSRPSATDKKDKARMSTRPQKRVIYTMPEYDDDLASLDGEIPEESVEADKDDPENETDTELESLKEDGNDETDLETDTADSGSVANDLPPNAPPKYSTKHTVQIAVCKLSDIDQSPLDATSAKTYLLPRVETMFKLRKIIKSDFAAEINWFGFEKVIHIVSCIVSTFEEEEDENGMAIVKEYCSNRIDEDAYSQWVDWAKNDFGVHGPYYIHVGLMQKGDNDSILGSKLLNKGTRGKLKENGLEFDRVATDGLILIPKEDYEDLTKQREENGVWREAMRQKKFDWKDVNTQAEFRRSDVGRQREVREVYAELEMRRMAGRENQRQIEKLREEIGELTRFPKAYQKLQGEFNVSERLRAMHERRVRNMDKAIEKGELRWVEDDFSEEARLWS